MQTEREIGSKRRFKVTVAASDHWVTIDKGRLFARLWTPSGGEADFQRSILLFHDSLGCIELWGEFPQFLAAATRCSVLAYDRLGFGRSDAYVGTLPPSFVHDEALVTVPRLCEWFHLRTLIPFGHSVGGGIAIATAAQHPEKCLAVITESAQSFVEERTISGVLEAKSRFAHPGQLKRLERYHGAKARWVLDAWTETWLAPSFANWSLDEDLPAVHCPVLALHGDQDQYGSRRHPERIARLSKGSSQVVLFEGCGHIPHREQPVRVLEEINNFLAQHSVNDLHINQR